MVKYVITLEPSRKLYENIREIKNEINQFSEDNLYLNDPPHITLYIGEFDDFLDNNFDKLIKKLKKKFSKVKIDINNLEIFEEDPITKKSTLYFPFNVYKKNIQEIQLELINYLNKFRKGRVINRYADVKEELNSLFQDDLEKYGYPFVGERLIPHVSIASFNSLEVERAREITLQKIMKGEHEANSLVIYSLDEAEDEIQEIKRYCLKDFDDIKKDVCEGNKKLEENNLITLTWGNLSAIDESETFLAIKPSGVSYDELTYDMISIVDMVSGELIEGLKPSSDTKTHLELYKGFSGIQSVVHTHSTYATMFAQAQKPIRCLGTTHADYFYGFVPVVDKISQLRVNEDYEKNTGKLIVNFFRRKDWSYEKKPGCLVPSHGPFVWGKSIKQAVENAIVLEKVAKLNFGTEILNKKIKQMDKHLHDKHYFRKNGEDKYYGQ